MSATSDRAPQTAHDEATLHAVARRVLWLATASVRHANRRLRLAL